MGRPWSHTRPGAAFLRCASTARYVAVAVPPPGATAEPAAWGSIGGGGGSWGP
jgi:hypothetical protein